MNYSWDIVYGYESSSRHGDYLPRPIVGLLYSTCTTCTVIERVPVSGWLRKVTPWKCDERLLQVPKYTSPFRKIPVDQVAMLQWVSFLFHKTPVSQGTTSSLPFFCYHLPLMKRVMMKLLTKVTMIWLNYTVAFWACHAVSCHYVLVKRSKWLESR